VALRDAYTDFMLSRQAMQCAPATLNFYGYTLNAFLTWLEKQGIGAPADITARHVRDYLSELAGTGKADTTLHDNARAIKTLVRFWHAENYLPAPVTFAMPRLGKKRLPVLAPREVEAVIRACLKPRDKALIYFLVDSGLRREELCRLNWGDVEIGSGLVTVKRGKGGKARSAVIGASTRRSLLAYRRTLHDVTPESPMLQAPNGKRLTVWGLNLLFRRLSKRSGIHVTPHSLRRTFVILSLRAGMDSLHLQALGGWSGLEMVQHYAQMVTDDLVQAHEAHSPIDNLSRLK
jgi:site-specific recombinase XerD